MLFIVLLVSHYWKQFLFLRRKGTVSINMKFCFFSMKYRMNEFIFISSNDVTQLLSLLLIHDNSSINLYLFPTNGVLFLKVRSSVMIKGQYLRLYIKKCMFPFSFYHIAYTLHLEYKKAIGFL